MRKRFFAVLLSMVMCISLLSITAMAQNTLLPGEPSVPEAYAKYNKGILTFCYDSFKDKNDYEIPETLSESSTIPWEKKLSDIDTVVFDESFKDYKPTTMRKWFYGCENLTEIIGIENLNTENVTDMFDTFAFCKSLTKLDVSHFDTSKVTDMSFMFLQCGLLTNLDVSGFNTSKATSMFGMFEDCSQLIALDVSGFDTSNVTEMSFMFAGCKVLTSLDVTSFNTSKVKSTYYMFGQCENLSVLDLSSFDTSSIKYKTGFDLEDSNHYYGIREMFEGCTKLKTIYVSDLWELDEDVINNSSDVFKYCDNLVGGAGTEYVDPSEPLSLIDIGPAPTTDAKYACVDCPESSAPGYLTFVAKVDFAGGDGATGEAPASVKGIQGEDIVLPSGSSLSKSGYKFIGWSDGTKTYEAGAKYKIGTSNIKFTAQWEKSAEPTPSGTPNGNPTPTTTPGGNGGSGNGNGGSSNGSGVVIPTPTTPPAQKPTGNATKSAGEFVERCYNVCLGRSSDEAGFRYWLDMLNSGDSCGAEVGYGFVFSAEYMMKNTSNEQFVNDMYSMFFGREADAEGFNSWVEQLNNGASRLQVYAGFASSPEFSNLCGEYGIIGVSILNDDAINAAGDVGKFVGRLYKICLSRYPDYCGFTAWTKGLQEGSKTGSTCAYGFIFSGEFMSRGLSNEEFVVYMYKVFFDREADEAGYNLWLGVLNNGGSYEEVFNGFTGSTEFANLCASYGINA